MLIRYFVVVGFLIFQKFPFFRTNIARPVSQKRKKRSIAIKEYYGNTVDYIYQRIKNKFYRRHYSLELIT